MNRVMNQSQNDSSSRAVDPVTDGEQADAVYREVKFRHSRHFAPILSELKSSILVSTYAAGKVASVGTVEGAFSMSFHNFEQAMGVAVRAGSIAVGAKGQIWFMKNGDELAARIEPAGTYDACYLTRSSLITGNIHVHEMAWGERKSEDGSVPTTSHCAAPGVLL
jgi:uncharacterized protein (TIGR03032 family)